MSASPEQAVQPPARPGRPTQARPGLRERKKARTRAAIREHAFRLFRAQGYDATTVEQIADAAEVSPSTFFRYFPTKEDVVLQDDLDLLWMEAIQEQPPEMSPIAALRAGVHAAFARMGEGEWAQMRETTELAMAVPAVRGRMLEELARTTQESPKRWRSGRAATPATSPSAPWPAPSWGWPWPPSSTKVATSWPSTTRPSWLPSLTDSSAA